MFVILAALLFSGPYPATVINIVDGDTFDVVIEVLPDRRVVERIRFQGVDTPEKNSSRACEVRDANRAQQFVEDKINQAGNQVELFNLMSGKYRVVADVFIDGEPLADQIIEAGLGMPYYGGKRPEWECYEL